MSIQTEVRAFVRNRIEGLRKERQALTERAQIEDDAQNRRRARIAELDDMIGEAEVMVRSGDSNAR